MDNKPMYADELLVSAVEGAEMLIDMVRASMIEEGAMPPKPFLDWYTTNLGYRFATEEHMLANGQLTKERAAAFNELIAEVQLLRKILNGAKLFTLMAKLDDIMLKRKVSLPLSFDSSHKGRV